eukprot:COSAG02_NODE_343_length_24147_cov_30.662051_22_plen_182_part_00
MYHLCSDHTPLTTRKLVHNATPARCRLSFVHTLQTSSLCCGQQPQRRASRSVPAWVAVALPISADAVEAAVVSTSRPATPPARPQRNLHPNWGQQHRAVGATMSLRSVSEPGTSNTHTRAPRTTVPAVRIRRAGDLSRAGAPRRGPSARARARPAVGLQYTSIARDKNLGQISGTETLETE